MILTFSNPLCSSITIFVVMNLQGLVDNINTSLNKRKDNDGSVAELTRTEIIKCIQSDRVRFRGVNLSGLDLSKLVRYQYGPDLSFVDFSYACIRKTNFSRANLQKAKFGVGHKRCFIF
ncbi:hypothetical protein B296_00016574 [Ensete ventricosum]|uniref:Uncharacterized protein n=1 Tax=Ensete ventricosum TaxID=4639 RepID=A0A427AVC1_ENSVE|nr:hypothetical protein B296_00016574 [Ensete ventricosum]